MSKIEVQLAASIIPDDHQVWKFSPGKTYRFYNAVRDARKAFLDIRGLDQLPRDPFEWVDDDVLKVISEDRWNREIQSRQRGNQAHGSEGVSKEDRKRLTYLKELIFEAKLGDLVVVPVDGYRKEVLIGEIVSEPGKVDEIIAKDGEFTFSYVGRPVRWLAGIEKRKLSGALLEKLHSPTAMFLLGKSIRHEIYEFAYGDYVFDGEFVASFHVGKDKFTAEDSAVVSVWFNAIEVLQDSIDRGKTGNLPESFYAMGLEALADARASELNINVNSPGSFSFRSKDPFALALVALFALSACSPQQVVNDQVTVKLKTVGGAGHGCQQQIEDSVKAMAGALGAKRAEDMCKLGVRAANDAKMTVSATLKH